MMMSMVNNDATSPRLAFDPPTVRARFRMGDHFPPDERVGQFVIGLAAAMDDLQLLHSLLFPPDDPNRDDFTASERSALMRRLLGTIWEAHLFVEGASRYADVAAFLDEVKDSYPDGQTYSGDELLTLLRGGAGATRPELRNIMRVARNATFHYQQVGSDEFRDVLTALADETGEFSGGEKMPSIRMNFAEDVMLNLALRDLDQEGIDFEEIAKSLAPTVIAVVHLAQVAADLWLGARGGLRFEPVEDA
jgi:hypothetical protein